MTARNVIAIVVALVYVAIAGWIVRSQGEAHRAAIREKRELLASRGAPTPSKPDATGPERAGASRAGTIENVSKNGDRDQAGDSSGHADEHGDHSSSTASPHRSAAPSQGAHPRASTPIAKKIPGPRGSPPGRSAGAPSSAPPVAPEPLPRPPSDLDNWANALQLSALTASDETRLGQVLGGFLLAGRIRSDDGSGLKRVEKTAEPILAQRSRKDISYTFTVIDSDRIYAFSLPGGFVFVSRGLLEFLGDDDEYSLEFLLAHEIAHIDRRHALKLLAPGNEQLKKAGTGTIEQFRIPLALGYPDDMEFDADAWANEILIKRLNRSRYRTLTFLRKLEGYSKRAPSFYNGHAARNDVPNVFEEHYRGHPAAWKRLEKLTKPAGDAAAVAPRQ
jgi:hypothetical protein